MTTAQPGDPRDLHTTDNLFNARDDARSQEGQQRDWMPYLPASSSPFCPADVDPDALTWAETVAPGGYTHKIIARGTRLRFEDVDGEACAHVVLYNALEPWERYNAADSVKIPWQAYLSTGHPLLSGDGRALATVAADTSGHHDTFCGTMTTAQTVEKYGDAALHGVFPSGTGLLEQAGAKHGLSERDIPPTVSFFKGVDVAEDGALTFHGGAGAGATIDLVAELPLIVLVANSPHPLDPRADYVSGALRIHGWRGTPTGPGSEFFAAGPERHRAYLNSIDYAEARGL